MDINIFNQIAGEIMALSPADGLAIATLAVLEGVLSVDNSLVLAILVRSLPKSQQKKALTYGIAGAFFFRILALIFAATLIKFMAFKFIGGAYLVYLAMKHMFFFYKEDAHQTRAATASSFWKTVLVVEMTDIAFSVDSITTAVAMSNKLTVVWLGGILGIIFLRFAAGFFIKLLESLPRLEDLAYQLIFFVGLKLLLESFHIEIAHGIFWLMMGVIVILGSALVYRDHHQRQTASSFQNRLLNQLKTGEISPEQALDMPHVPREVISYLREQNIITVRPPGPA